MNTKQKTTAGKTATNTTKGNGSWRKTTRNGKRVLISPDGRIYHGTAQEVRDAALSPQLRKNLAQSLRLHLYCRNHGTFSTSEMRAYCAESRRETISLLNWGILGIGTSVRLSEATYIKIKAGARLVADDFDKYIEDIFENAIGALLDIAAETTGRRELPLTRHERAALDRIRATEEQVKALTKARAERLMAESKARAAALRQK